MQTSWMMGEGARPRRGIASQWGKRLVAVALGLLLFQGSAVASAEDVFRVEVRSPATTASTPTPDASLHVEVIRPTTVPQTNGKRILIYHTHT